MAALIDASNISRLTFPQPAWRYLLLFQSWNQLQSWGCSVVAALVLISSLLTFLEPRFLTFEGMLVGAVLGSLCSVIMVLPTEFVVRPRSDHLFATLKSEVEALGHVLLDSRTDAAVYRQKMPRYWRWDEGNVTIERVGKGLVVRGPLVIVLKVRRSLVSR